MPKKIGDIATNPPHTSTLCSKDDRRSVLQGLGARSEVVNWRPVVRELHKIKRRFSRHQQALQLLADSPAKDGVVIELKKGIEQSQKLLALCFSQATRS